MTARAEVAMLHRVDPAPPTLPPSLAAQYCRPEELESYLGARRDLPRLDPGTMTADRLQSPGLLLTFDDGFRSVLTAALPLLERERVHAIVFVTNGFVSGACRPYERALWAMLSAAPRWFDADGRERILVSDIQRHRLYEELRIPLKPLSYRRREAALQGMAESNRIVQEDSGAPPEPSDYLNWDELVELDRSPWIHIGGHSRTHPQLNALGTLSAAREIVRGKRELESRLGHAVNWFAYPYGAHGRRSRALVRWAGYRGAFATVAGEPTDPFCLPRVDPLEPMR